MKATTASSLLILLMHLSAHPAMAASSIKELVSNETLAAYCATVPLDSETTTTLPGLDGTDVTGSVHCEAEDLVPGSSNVFDISGSGTGSDDDGIEDGSDDDSGDDSSDDDSGDDDSGGNDDGGDDDGDDD